jgi:hypothetical protein
MTVSSRTVVMLTALALLAGWFGASVTHNASSRGQATPVSRSIRPIGTSPATPPTAEKLRERKSDAPLPERGRNPFVYGSRMSTRTGPMRDREAPETAVVPQPVEPVAPPAPVFRLAGIASDVKDGVTVLTAILNDNGSIVFVKGGEKLSNGYSVVRVEELSVTLIDSQGVTQTIKLP